MYINMSTMTSLSITFIRGIVRVKYVFSEHGCCSCSTTLQLIYSFNSIRFVAYAFYYTYIGCSRQYLKGTKRVTTGKSNLEIITCPGRLPIHYLPLLFTRTS